jgi:hypothetical protein
MRTCSLTRTTAINISFDILLDLGPEVSPYDQVFALSKCKVAYKRIIVMHTNNLYSQGSIFWNYKG